MGMDRNVPSVPIPPSVVQLPGTDFAPAPKAEGTKVEFNH